MNQFTVSLWGDEAFSAVLSMKSIPEIIKIITRDTSPPLYNITEHIWFQIFGTSEVAIRSLSSLYFLVAVFFVYKIGAFLWDKKTGILAALLTFLNPFFFAYAFEGRMYSILAAGVCASMYFFIKIIFAKESKPNIKDLIGYVLGTSWMLYSHHFSIFALFVQGPWFLKEFMFGKRNVAISIFKSIVAIVILYSPWVIPLYKQTRMVGGGFWLGTPNLKDLGDLFLKKYLNVSLVALAFRRWTKDREKSFFLISWFFVPILITWLVSQKFQSIFFDRYLLYTIPGAMILAASQGKRLASTVVLVIVIASFLSADIYYFTHPIKRPFRDLANYVKETKKEEDYLINWNAGAHHLWESKYYKIPAPLYIPGEGKLPFFVGTALMGQGDVINDLPDVLPQTDKKVGRIGVITSGNVDDVNLVGYTKHEVKVFGPTSSLGSDIKFIWYKR